MRYTKWERAFYVGSLLRILFTVLFFSGLFWGRFFSIVSFIIFPLIFSYPKFAVLMVCGLIVAVLAWFLSLLFSLLEIKFHKMRKASYITLCIAYFADLVASLLSPNVWGVAVPCSVVALLFLAWGIKCFLECRKLSNKES